MYMLAFSSCFRYFNCSKPDVPNWRLSPAYERFETECRFPEVFDSVKNECTTHKQATCVGISKADKFECDYMYKRCWRQPCMSCYERAVNCEQLPDGYHAHTGRPNSPYYVRCEDGYTVEYLTCKQPKIIFSATRRECVHYYSV
ncbi:fibropellin-1 [Elysia marginata]|uniref:Fibropellin-1 n=1 Tax=Elysia marginata TaxID=1093978 RepID=A0AAV4K1Q7_9GAST|nr:fibropellin-1 [Elysia marginata]